MSASAEQIRKRELALDLWSRGIAIRKIGLQLGKTSAAITKIAKRARANGDPRAKYRSTLFRMHHVIGRPRTYKSTPGRIPAELRPRIILEAAKRGTDAAGIIEAVLINAFESEWFLRVVLKEDGEDGGRANRPGMRVGRAA